MKLLGLIDRGAITLGDPGERSAYLKRIIIAEGGDGQRYTYITPFWDLVDKRWKSINLPREDILHTYLEEYITQPPLTERDLNKCLKTAISYKKGTLIADYEAWVESKGLWIPSGVMQYLRPARISPALGSVAESIYTGEYSLSGLRGFPLFSLFVEEWVRENG